MVFKKTKAKAARKRKPVNKKKKPAKKKEKAEQDFLADVPDDKRFLMCDGSVLSNLVQLRDSLKKMNDGIFSYHVNNERNDFKNWIREVIGDKKLAAQISRLKSSKAMYQKVAAAVRRHARK